jgi:hypothetical protein
VNDLESFLAVEEFERIFDLAMPDSTATKYLIGMKNDVPLAERVVTREMAEESARNKGY